MKRIPRGPHSGPLTYPFAHLKPFSFSCTIWAERRELFQMFKREKKVYLELTDAERRLVRMYLMNWRNKLTAQGRDAGPVNDLLVKLMS